MKAIEDFLRRYHRAVYARSNEIRLTMQEASDLARDIDILLVRLASRESDTVEISVDGGRITP